MEKFIIENLMQAPKLIDLVSLGGLYFLYIKLNKISEKVVEVEKLISYIRGKYE